MNDPYRHIEILQQALASDKSRIAFLLGAGCPSSISIQDGDGDKPLILDIEGLTELVLRKISKDIDKIKKRISLPEGKKVTIEGILTQIRLLIEVVGDSSIDNLTKKDLETLEKTICEEITSAVDKELPNNETPYHQLAAWIVGIPRDNPVEIFTSNYDLLIESAFESKNVPYFDGFIGSRKAFFDLHAIENEKMPSRWAKLWKLHGSINWWNDSNAGVFRGHGESDENKQMIYPSHLKYDQSRRMPYLAMQDRLGHFLATGQAALITCGYSFVDQHLNAAILQRLAANPRAICFGLLYDNIEAYPEAIARAKETTNLSLIARNGAFIGGQQINWGKKESDNLKYYDFCMKDTDPIQCGIGDFQVLGRFLLNQLGYTHRNEEDNHAD